MIKPEMDECRNIRLLNDSAERKACIDDLLHFVSEISLAEQGSNIMSAKERDQVKNKKKSFYFLLTTFLHKGGCDEKDTFTIIWEQLM